MAPTQNSTEAAVPVNESPVTLTCHQLVAESNTATIAETVGRLAVNVNAHPDGAEHVASSEVFKKTTAVPTLFAV